MAYCEATHEAVASGLGKLYIIDCKKMALIQTLNAGSRAGTSISKVEFSPDGRFIIALANSLEKTLMIFDRQALNAEQSESAPTTKTTDAKSE